MDRGKHVSSSRWYTDNSNIGIIIYDNIVNIFYYFFVRQLVQIMFITFTHCFTSGERKIWWSIKRSQNIMKMMVWKIFFCFIWYLWTAPVVKNNHIRARIYFTFQKMLLKQNWKSLSTKFRPQGKHWKNCYRVKLILARFCNLITLTLG